MTVIAWDGTTLAVDSAASCGSALQSVTKARVFEADGRPYVAVGVGMFRAIVAMQAWAEEGASIESFPDLAADDVDEALLLVVDLATGRVTRFDGTPHGYSIESVPAAWGVGDGVCLGAMLQGATAAGAVRLTCEHVDGCAPPVRLVTGSHPDAVLTAPA